MVPELLKRYPAASKMARKLVSLYPYSARLGAKFWSWFAFLEESEHWELEKVRQYQFEQLRALLSRLVATSSFYAQRIDATSIRKIETLKDLQQNVALLSRREFGANHSQILSRTFNRRACIQGCTSGTTGHALEFFHPAESKALEWASICHQWKRVGYDPVHSRRAEFRGLTSARRLFEEYPEQNMVRFSILDLRAETLPRMAEVIASRELKFFHGYPSAMYLLAQEVLNSGIRFPEPTAFLLASEVVYDFQVKKLEQVFPNARLFAHYGCAERTVLAGWCEHRRVYHVLPQYSVVEVDPVTSEIIGTNLHNDVNGFVRYRMTDRAGGAETSPCPQCQRPYTPVLTSLDGRSEDYLYSRERGWIAPAIVTYPLKHLQSILELQFEQEDEDRITVKYVLRPGAADETTQGELREIEQGLRYLLGKAPRLEFRHVEDIPRGPTGKFKWIISRLNPPR